MATSITTTTAPVTVPVTTATTTATATTSVNTSTASTLTSAAPAQSQGFSATISSWVAGVVDAIRNCLAKLPLIGSFFAKEQPATTTATTTTNAATTTYSDAQIVDMIRGIFVAPATSTGTTSVAVPQADVVAYALSVFGQITAPEAKVEAFQVVLAASNSTDDIAQQFYNAMNDQTQTEFRRQIYLANGSSDVDATGVRRGVGFGEHIIATAIRSPLAQQAAANHRAAILAGTTATTTATTTSTGTTSTI